MKSKCGFGLATLAIVALVAMAGADLPGIYNYRAAVKSVHDGDTVRVDIDLGMRLVIRDEPIRLYGIDAPEAVGTTKVAGIASRDYLVELLNNRRVYLETYKDQEDKFGRLLGTLWVEGKDDWCPLNSWCNVNSRMVSAGHAIYKTY